MGQEMVPGIAGVVGRIPLVRCMRNVQVGDRDPTKVVIAQSRNHFKKVIERLRIDACHVALINLGFGRLLPSPCYLLISLGQLSYAECFLNCKACKGRMQAPRRPASGPSSAGSTCVPPFGIPPAAGRPGAVSA